MSEDIISCLLLTAFIDIANFHNGKGDASVNKQIKRFEGKVMKIGVISDTHASSLSPEIIEKLKGLNLNLIIHCGDYTGVDIVHQLKELGNFCGVAGNMDPPAIRELLKEKEVIEVGDKRIGVFHGHGLFLTDRRLEKEFKGEKIDLYLHGHTHRLRNEKKKDIYYLNPGPFPKSMLIVSLEKGKEIKIEVVSFE